VPSGLRLAAGSVPSAFWLAGLCCMGWGRVSCGYGVAAWMHLAFFGFGAPVHVCEERRFWRCLQSGVRLFIFVGTMS